MGRTNFFLVDGSPGSAAADLPLREAAMHLGLQAWFSEQAHFAQLPDAVAAFQEQAAERGQTGTLP